MSVKSIVGNWPDDNGRPVQPFSNEQCNKIISLPKTFNPGIFLTPEYNKDQSNAVKLSQTKFEVLFPKLENNGKAFVKIDNFIFSVIIRETLGGEDEKTIEKILLNPLQSKILDLGQVKRRSLWVSPFDPLKEKVLPLASVQFKIKFEAVDHEVKRSGPQKLSKEKMEHFLRSQVFSENPFLEPNYNFYYEEEGIYYGLSASNLDYEKKSEKGGGSWNHSPIRAGKVSEHTRFEFFSLAPEQVQIMEKEIPKESIEHFKFTLSFLEDPKKLKGGIKPKIMEAEALENKLNNLIKQGQSVCFKEKFDIEQEGISLTLTSARVDSSQFEEYLPVEMNGVNSPNRALEYDKTISVQFDWPVTDFIVVDSRMGQNKATAIEVGVSKIEGDEENRKYYLPVDEIEEHLKNCRDHFALGANFPIQIGRQRFEISFESLQSKSTVHNELSKKINPPWVVQPETKVNFKNFLPSKVILVNNKEPKVAAKVLFEASLKSSAKDKQSPSISEEELLNEAKEKFIEECPLGLVHGATVGWTDAAGFTYEFRVKELELDNGTKIQGRDGEFYTLCQFVEGTEFSLKSVGNFAQKKEEKKLTLPEKIDKMLFDAKIGGIPQKTKDIIEKIYLQRGIFSNLYHEMEVNPTSGIVLYGPPGTGKTTFAQAFAEKLLNIKKDNIQEISTSSLLNKWLGESEKGIRKAFQKSLDEWNSFKEDSELHCLIFDEFDAIAKERKGDGPFDSIITQLLACMGGLNEQKNVIVIGTTNRFELLDPALKREGRFGEQIEFSIPNKIGREEIFKLHLKQCIEKNLLDEEMVKELAEKTEGCTGADIRGVCRRAFEKATARLANAVNLEEDTKFTNFVEKYPEAARLKREDFDDILKSEKQSDEWKGMYS